MSKSVTYTNPATTRDYCDARCHERVLCNGSIYLPIALVVSLIVIASLGYRGLVSGAVVGGVGLGLTVTATIFFMMGSEKPYKVLAVAFAILAALSALAVAGYIPLKAISIIHIVTTSVIASGMIAYGCAAKMC